MRILVTNDDGIMAPGLLALRRAMAQLGDVTVVAPTTPQSAVAHSITLMDPIRVHRVSLGDGAFGYGVEGRPADCVKLALLELMPERPDLVASGVNLGVNAGINVLYSGTVAAAVEGAFFGVPAVAVSIEDSDAADFDGAAQIARRLVDQLLARAAGRPILFNINVPDLSQGPPAGVRVVTQSLKGWREGWEKRSDPRGRTYYWMIGDLEPEDVGIDSDVAALADRYVTITPLQFDLTDHARMEEMRGWGLGLER
ncbi:MAG: 5'/3'-nucleotidase SurE [Planctomycetota bacterium]|nr:5'/3'-nucleotidase SurE [Planctomycetota bacterium]